MQIRHYAPCGGGGCDWVETDTALQNGRWYASNQQLPDGTQIVVGGRGVGTVEYVPANGRGTYDIPLLYKVHIITYTSTYISINYQMSIQSSNPNSVSFKNTHSR